MGTLARTLSECAHSSPHDAPPVHTLTKRVDTGCYDRLDPPRPASTYTIPHCCGATQDVAHTSPHLHWVAHCCRRAVRAALAATRGHQRGARPDGALAPAGEPAAGPREPVQRSQAGQVRSKAPMLAALVKRRSHDSGRLPPGALLCPFSHAAAGGAQGGSATLTRSAKIE